MKHLPLIPVEPVRRMDANKRARLREANRKNRIRRQRDGHSYYAKNRTEILRQAAKARIRKSLGDRRQTRYNEIGTTMKTITASLCSRQRSVREAYRYLQEICSSIGNNGHTVVAATGITLDFDNVAPVTRPAASGGTIRKISIPAISVSDTLANSIEEATTLCHHYDLLIKELGARSVDWRRTFANNPDVEPLLKECAATIRKLRVVYNRNIKKLSTVSDKLIPEKFRAICDTLSSAITNNINYDSFQEAYVTTKSGTATTITYELELQGLSVGDSYAENYFIVISLVSDSGTEQVSCHATTHQEAEVPGSYDVGQSFATTAQALEIVDTLMELDSFDAHLYDTPLDVNEKSIDLSAYKAKILKLELNKASQTLELHTKTLMTQAQLNPILEAIMGQFPKSIPVGKVKFRTFAEQVISFSATKPPMLDDLPVVVMEISPGKFAVSIRTDVNKEQTIPTIAKKVVRTVKGSVLGDIATSDIRSVVTFRLTGTRRTDIKQMREFIEGMSEHLNPAQVKKVRKALGV